jgi:hypothetical protein
MPKGRVITMRRIFRVLAALAALVLVGSVAYVARMPDPVNAAVN